MELLLQIVLAVYLFRCVTDMCHVTVQSFDDTIEYALQIQAFHVVLECSEEKSKLYRHGKI